MMDFWFEYLGWSKNGACWKIRIHDLMWCEIDEYGFATIIKNKEWSSVTKKDSNITLPRPIRDEKTLNALMMILTYR